MPIVIDQPTRITAAGKLSGERNRHTTPEGAKYVAICLPAFSPDAAHRDLG